MGVFWKTTRGWDSVKASNAGEDPETLSDLGATTVRSPGVRGREARVGVGTGRT